MPCFNANETVSALVADTVLELMRSGGTGEVLMVNSAGVYLGTKSHIWLLCDISWGMVPNGIAVECYGKLIDQFAIREGTLFEYCENTLIFGGRALKLLVKTDNRKDLGDNKPKPSIVLEAARQLADMRRISGISMLVSPLILDDNSFDVSSLNPYCERAYPLFLRLMQAVRKATENDIRDCVDSLLGLGTGLTPSADDTMLGMIYAFRMLGDYTESVKMLRAAIKDMCDTRTHRVSAAYLKAIIDGARFERVERVWRGLCGIEPFDLTALLQVGSNSGSEMLLGILISLRLRCYI